MNRKLLGVRCISEPHTQAHSTRLQSLFMLSCEVNRTDSMYARAVGQAHLIASHFAWISRNRLQRRGIPPDIDNRGGRCFIETRRARGKRTTGKNASIRNQCFVAKEQLSLSNFHEYENVIGETINSSNFATFSFFVLFNKYLYSTC